MLRPSAGRSVESGWVWSRRGALDLGKLQIVYFKLPQDRLQSLGKREIVSWKEKPPEGGFVVCLCLYAHIN